MASTDPEAAMAAEPSSGGAWMECHFVDVLVMAEGRDTVSAPVVNVMAEAGDKQSQGLDVLQGREVVAVLEEYSRP